VTLISAPITKALTFSRAKNGSDITKWVEEIEHCSGVLALPPSYPQQIECDVSLSSPLYTTDQTVGVIAIWYVHCYIYAQFKHWSQ
jgi:hypothetical protein